MKVMYFAWLRERLNRGEEEVDPPETVKTVADLIAWLVASDEGNELAFGNTKIIRAAIDAQIVGHDTPLGGAKVVALFPPMTGG
jgi:molybdopterin synthase sulfur carrier subunit